MITTCKFRSLLHMSLNSLNCTLPLFLLILINVNDYQLFIPMTFYFLSAYSLCGRGGSINSHPGNRTFREWVYTRKTKYNLASTKIEKSAVVDQVLDLVRGLKPPGRFLQKQRGEDGQ